MDQTAVFFSPVGRLNLLADEKGLKELCLGDPTDLTDPAEQKYSDMACDADDNSVTAKILQETKDWLRRYFAGEKPEITELKLNLSGTAFRQKVWKILCEIPYGQTVTYGQIAARIAREEGKKKMSAQAVGGAVGHNPIAIIVPCHRVIGSDGSLTGYAYGLDMKRRLLEHEHAGRRDKW
ncbi:MAG: methylated-DNA--[protein]-cysteine S-methyltransferase [Lachnospiraceae bacterium]|nr:methylated-DNA--[protein]-cysteine S-methyltransferase [Lachnospiraceae bacterium]